MLINNNHNDHTEKIRKCKEYIEALEEERHKIQVFQRELPLCLELVTQAIEACKQQLCGTTTDNFHGQSESFEQISSEGPVMEEFIPMKRTSPSVDDELQSKKTKKNRTKNNRSRDSKSNDKSSNKSDWLREVQLWNEPPDPPPKEDLPKKVKVMEVKKNGTYGACQPFKRGKCMGIEPPSMDKSAAVASLTAEKGGGDEGGRKRDEKERRQSKRKTRRCWSSELHRRFLQALQQLGGSHVATPKQIRELMNVDGLTNDEVKSHLQKFRLHTRRPSFSMHNVDNNNSQAPQFVVVGGIWMPPPEYAAMAILPPPLNQEQHHNKKFHSSEEGSHSHSEGKVHSNSPANSTHSTTAWPEY